MNVKTITIFKGAVKIEQNAQINCIMFQLGYKKNNPFKIGKKSTSHHSVSILAIYGLSLSNFRKGQYML